MQTQLVVVVLLFLLNDFFLLGMELSYFLLYDWFPSLMFKWCLVSHKGITTSHIEVLLGKYIDIN